jgi:hypothetical protein
MSACRRDWVIEKRPNLGNGRRTGDVHGNDPGIDVGYRLRPGRLARDIAAYDRNCRC